VGEEVPARRVVQRRGKPCQAAQGRARPRLAAPS
jgi:hypothetical protein